MGKGKGHIPIRTCIACGKKKKKDDLIRFIVGMNGALIRDDKGKGHGRGKYACNLKSCLERL